MLDLARISQGKRVHRIACSSLWGVVEETDRLASRNVHRFPLRPASALPAGGEALFSARGVPLTSGEKCEYNE